MRIQEGNLVTIGYSFKSLEGILLGTSEYSGPFTFVFGSGDALLGLEKNLLGKSSGDSLSFIVSAQDGYGLVDESLVRVLPRALIDFAGELQLGQRVKGDMGGVLPLAYDFWVRSIDSQTVTLDANHPMAGMDLDFDVDILYVGDQSEADSFQSHTTCCGGSCSQDSTSCSGQGCSSK